MTQKLSLFAGCALALVLCLPGHAQDTPSLGDLARQAQKDKASTPSKKVLTNDDLPSGLGQGSSGLAGGLGKVAQPTSAAKQNAPAAPSDELDQLESLLNQVASLDRETLIRNVLQDAAESNFPGRLVWEQKLMSARDSYVIQGRALLDKARQIRASMEGLKGIQNPDDPRVKDLANRLKQLVQEGTRTGATFQAVMMEGRDLAGDASAR